MPLVNRLESKFGRFAIPHLTLALIIGQVVAYIANMTPAAAGHAALLDNIRLDPDKVLQGEWWRLLTFLFDPPPTNALFAFFAWYLFYLMGTTLEAMWGRFRYTLYLLIGYVASVGLAFITWYATGGGPGEIATNAFLYGSVFLAFARLFPDFTLLLMFILPVKIKWLAMLTWIGYAWMFLIGPWQIRAMVLAAVFNYLLFFGREIVRNMQQGHRRMKFQSRSLQGRGAGDRARLTHECRVCGLTSEASPKTQFRYCSQCDPDYCYCPDHLQNHEHVKTPASVATPSG